MVISCNTSQKEEKECICVKYVIYAVLPRFQLCCNLRVFSAKFYFQIFRGDTKMVNSKSVFRPATISALAGKKSQIFTLSILYLMCDSWILNILIVSLQGSCPQYPNTAFILTRRCLLQRALAFHWRFGHYWKRKEKMVWGVYFVLLVWKKAYI